MNERRSSDLAGARPPTRPETRPLEGDTGPDVMGEDMDRLPPPAFPPGHRRNWIHRSRGAGEGEGDDRLGAEREGRIPPGALYSPDAPIRRIEDPFEGGRGSDAVGRVGSQFDVHHTELRVDAVADLLAELAREVRQRRSGRLLWQPSASPLEAALRGILAGYLRQPEPEGRDG